MAGHDREPGPVAAGPVANDLAVPEEPAGQAPRPGEQHLHSPASGVACCPQIRAAPPAEARGAAMISGEPPDRERVR